MDSFSAAGKIFLPSFELPEDHGGIGQYIGALSATFGDRLECRRVAPSTSYLQLVNIMRSSAAGEIWLHHVLPLGTAAWLYAKVTGLPYVTFLHGLDFDRARMTWKKRLILRAILHNARLVITNSQALQSEVKAFAPNARLATLHPCVAPAFLTTTLIDRSIIPPHPLRLLTVARLVEHKGFLQVLKALSSFEDAHYTIVGHGPYEETLRTYIEEHDLASRVALRTDVETTAELIGLYDTHDVFVMPTQKTPTDREGFGIVYLEAAARGLPVVASNLPGVDEAVLDGETGLLVPKGDQEALITALQELCNDPNRRLTLGLAGRNRVIRYFTQETFSTRAKTLLAPKISVIIPVYNHGNTIAKTLAALATQTYRNLELIIVNDGSTDNTQTAIEEIVDAGGRFLGDLPVTILTQKNSGAQHARNRGFSEATGQYVIFCDADVLMAPQMLEQMVATLIANPEASFVYSRFRFGWKLFRSQAFDLKTLKTLNYIHTTSLCCRADFPGFDQELKRFQDWDVWLALASRGKKGLFLKKTLFRVIIDGPSRLGSAWLPAFVYKIPWRRLGFTPRRVAKYEAAREIVYRKHEHHPE